MVAAKAGLLAGGAAALGVMLPVAGSTLARTGMLYLAGGPGAFMAQQAATREILERANYADLAKQYDPLDPTGFTLSWLFPLPFTGYGAWHNIKAAPKPAPKGENKPVAGDQVPGEPMADEPPARTSTSDDVDAALVHNLTLQQDAHEAAMAAQVAHADPVQANIDATPTEASIGGLETREVPVKDITLSEDVPQFKSGANAAGVVEPLGGSFDRTGVAPIQLWERTDGRLEVISGRHRLDLARRSGEETIPAQIHREADGFDVRRAAALDAELNIRDGQGKVRDYVDYFQATGIDRATAEQRGLLARSTGKRAYAIANDGSPELIAAHRAGAVSDEAAVAIAGAAPGDSRLQAVGIRAVQDGKTIAQAANTVRAVKLLAGERADDAAGDLFGFDDSAMREAESMAKIATAKQREVQTRLSAISGAAKRPELAKAEGVNIKDAAAVLRRVEELRAESAAWENWTTNPALVEAIRAELHPDGAPLLQAHSAGDLAAKAALTDVPPEAGLTHAERVIEDRFRAQVHGDPEAALAAYAKLPDTAGGKIVNTDEARELSSDFAASRDSRALLARAVHGPASWVAKLQWRHLLAKPPETGEVLILGGGGGSGKTSSLKQIAPGFTDRYDAIFDTTLSKERTAIQAIEQALASGRRVTINFTARDPFESIVNGIIPRAEKKGRTVPLGIAAEAHTEAPKVLLALEAKYADDDRVRFQLVDNTGGPGAARIVGLGDYPQFDYNGLAERAVEAAREAYVKGDIGEPVYRGLVGEGESQASARSGEGESRPRNADVGGQPEPQRAPGGAGAGRGPQEGRTGAEELTPPPDSGGEQSLSPSALGDAHMRSVADRVASVERENPAAAQEMAAARELAAEGDDVNLGALDADLLQVAANCALSLGGA